MSAFLTTILFSLYTTPAFQTTDEARQQGEAAGDQAYPLDRNPYPLNSTLHTAWADGHEKSTRELCGK